MKNVILDSSSAILIYKCDVFTPLLDYCSPVIPEKVFSELTISGYDGADYFTDLCRSGMIKVLKQQTEIDGAITGKIHPGELGVLALYHDGEGDFIIIDDGKGGAYCRNNNIPYINALLTVKILFLNKIISEPEYIKAQKWLLENGRYSEEVIRWAESADQNQLDFFM